MKQAVKYQKQTGQDAVYFDAARTKLADALNVDNCFVSGTLITTMRGKVPVEDLQDGDKVLTRDRGFQPVCWHGCQTIDLTTDPDANAHRPVLLRANSLGPAQPERDMLVSPKHQILNINQNLMAEFGQYKSLIEARKLVGKPGIEHATVDSVTYHHLLFDRHEVILSDNLWSESFFLTRQVADMLSACTRAGEADAFAALRQKGNGATQTPARPSADILALVQP